MITTLRKLNIISTHPSDLALGGKTQNVSKVLKHHNKRRIGYLKQTRAFPFCLKGFSIMRRVKGREEWLAATRTDFSTQMPSA
ncbi:hypothetical protein CDAR_181861 [Caerostris darwini]|uniref:Uncharacterized protein n=1 Tax=Caerostris darwini TaxID=1538125 RepID=A0AAV4P068_9ARAC|nr:hypothetical protein CDAR_181861 [Caerostris darwini]